MNSNGDILYSSNDKSYNSNISGLNTLENINNINNISIHNNNSNLNVNNINNISSHNNNSNPSINNNDKNIITNPNNNALNHNNLNKKNSFIKNNRTSIFSEDNKKFEELQQNYKRLSNSKKNIDEINRRSSKIYEFDKEITLINDEEEKENIFNKRRPSNCSNTTNCSGSSINKKQSVQSNNSIKKDSKSECQFILKELIENEISFSKNLDILMNYYRFPLKDNKIISNIDLNCIFYGIPELAEFSKNLCNELNEAMNEEDNILYVSRVLISQVEKWDYYLRYCENYSQSKTTVKVLSKNSSRFKNFLKKAQSDNKCNKQDINSLLILPVQHGCRYPLLLARIKEKIAADSENYSSTTIKMVDAAECYMKKLGKLLNDLQQSDVFSKYTSEAELNNKFKVPLSIEDCPVSYFISKERRLLKSFDCVNTNTNKNIRIFIFGDMIMQTVYQKSSESDLGIKYKYLRIDPIENVMAQESDVNFGNTYQKAILNRFKKHDSNENYVKISYSSNIFGDEKYLGKPMTYTFNFSDRKTRKEFLYIIEISKGLFISNVLNVASRAIPPQIDDVLVCCSNYDRRSESEISIAIGDEAVAYEDAVDGWVQGENCTTHQCGYFPISVFVESDTSRDIYNNTELKVKYAYKQKGNEEISINSGDTVVPETYYHCSGWCYGRNLSTNEKGLFPLPFCHIQPGIITNPSKLKTHVMNQLSKPIILSKKKHSSLPLPLHKNNNMNENEKTGPFSYFNLNKELPVATIKKSQSNNSSYYSQSPLNDTNGSFINYRNSINDGNISGSLPSNGLRRMSSNVLLTMDMESDDSYIEDNNIPIPPQPEPLSIISSPLIKRRSTSLDYNLESIKQLSTNNYDYDDDDWDD
jgi:hypothetical protein